MLDWAVIITPVLLLGVLLLVGYAGCTFDPSGTGVITTDPLFPTAGIYIVVRVPTGLTVNRIDWYGALNGLPRSVGSDINPSPGITEGAGTIDVYVHNCGTGYGEWVFRCGVQVDPFPIASDEAQTEIPNEGQFSPRIKANFFGEVTGGILRVTYGGWE